MADVAAFVVENINRTTKQKIRNKAAKRQIMRKALEDMTSS